MTFLNSLMNGLFDLLMRLCATSSPWPALMVASLSASIIFVALFHLTASPQRLRRARNRLVARVLELLLFQHDLRVSVTACGRIVAANTVYLGQFLWPMVVGLIPLVLLFVQMEAWLARRPLRVGESAVLTVALDPTRSVLDTPVEVHPSPEVRLDSPAVRILAQNAVSWRIVALTAGTGTLDVTVEGRSEPKSLVTGDRLQRVSPRRVSAGALREVLAPAEPPLAATSAIRQIEITYPPRQMTIGLQQFSWISVVIVLMMTFSLLIARFVGISLV